MKARTLLAGLLAVAMLTSLAWAVAEGDRGTLVGTVTEKGETWIRVKPSDGESMRFMPRWIGGMPKDGGGLEKAMVQKIASVNVGQQVSLDWLMEEHPRVIRLDVVKAD